MGTTSKIKHVILIGAFIHFVLFIAVMDIYFASPLETNLPSIKMDYPPPAKRLVIFVADGLRAESIFTDEHAERMPYFTSTKLNRGSWGVSHTRVPTESRPGHVAIMAGIYEDPSAIFKGWQANPVDFDSVFNQSTTSWSWGSPDIVHLFNKENREHIHTESYHADLEDFGKANTHVLDTWVFDNVEYFISNSTYNKSRCGDVCKNGNIFFLHLLGLDTAGHSYKPNHPNYLINMMVVDEGINSTERLFREEFPDDSTAFIFTSDHGMTDWGSHGDGSPMETETIFLGWGAGFNVKNERIDIDQADISPLISILLGNNLPVNSVGKLPIAYLNMTKQGIASGIIANAKQLIALYDLKNAKLKKSTFPILYISYKDDGNMHLHLEKAIQNYENKIYEVATENAQKSIDMALLGIKYVQTFYRTPLLILVSCGFIFWLLYLASFIVSKIDNTPTNFNSSFAYDNLKLVFKTMIFVIFISLIIIINTQALSSKIYSYALFPVIMLFLLTLQFDSLIYMFSVISSIGFKKFIKMSSFYFLGIELLVLSFYERKFLFLQMCLVGAWLINKEIDNKYKTMWFFSSISLGAFTFFPTLSVSFAYKTFIFVVCFWLYLFYYRFRKELNKIISMDIVYPNYAYILRAHLILFILSCINTISVAALIETREDLLYIFNIISWCILCLALLMLFLSPTNLVIRMGNIFSSLMSIYILFTNTIEGPFTLLLILVLCQWIYHEHNFTPQLSDKSIFNLDFDKKTHFETPKVSDDFRKSFFLLSFVILSFFGTGNIASLSSFDPMWVRCFITIFSPFTMMGLILIKMTIPFLLVVCSFRAIYRNAEGRMLNVFCIVLFYCDIMVLQFMFLIKDEGSWKEIGTQLSNFIIVEVTTVILILYYFLATWLTTNKLYNRFVTNKSTMFKTK